MYQKDLPMMPDNFQFKYVLVSQKLIRYVQSKVLYLWFGYSHINSWFLEIVFGGFNLNFFSRLPCLNIYQLKTSTYHQFILFFQLFQCNACMCTRV